MHNYRTSCCVKSKHAKYCYSQICLNVQGKGDGMANFDGLYDMPEQTELREDCRSVVGKSKISLTASGIFVVYSHH